MYEHYHQSLLQCLLASLTGWKEIAVLPYEFPALKKEYGETEFVAIESICVDQDFMVHLGAVLKIKLPYGIVFKGEYLRNIAGHCRKFTPQSHPGHFVTMGQIDTEVQFEYGYTWVIDDMLRPSVEIEELAAQCERILLPMTDFVVHASEPVASYMYGTTSLEEFLQNLQLMLSEGGEA